MEEINCLNCPLITSAQMSNLRESGIVTLMDFISAPRELVVSSMEILDVDYPKLRESILRYLQPCPVSLRQAAAVEVMTPKSTGISGLDALLKGGLYPGDVIELYGKTGTGKTQLCMYLTSLFCRSEGEGSTVIYFDLKNDFYARRLLDLCGGKESGLDNVMVFRLPNLDRLLSKLDEIRGEFSGGVSGFYNRCRLLVMDSVPMAIYPSVNSDKYSWRYYQEQLLERLHWLADHMKLTVILVNHAVTLRPSSTGSASASSSSSASTTVKAALGNYWQHKISIRIQCSKKTGLSNNSIYYSGLVDKCSRGSCGGTFYFTVKTNKIQGVNVKP